MIFFSYHIVTLKFQYHPALIICTLSFTCTHIILHIYVCSYKYQIIDVVIQSDQSTATVPTISTVSTVPIDDGISRRKLFCSKMHPSFKFYQDVCQSKYQSLIVDCSSYFICIHIAA